MTKVQILALNNGRHWVNLITSIVDSEFIHCSQKLKLIYETKVNKQKLCLWEGYLGPIQTKKLKTKILESDEYYFNHNLIIYNISSSPQTFFLFHDLMGSPKYIRSPVSGGCYVEEFWNTDLELKKLFQKNTLPDSGELCSKLDVNLFKFFDRIGNFIHFKNSTNLKIDFQLINDKLFVLGIWIPSTLTPDEYMATLESWKNDEIIEKKICPIKGRWTDFFLRESFEFLNLEIFRLSDGKCIYAQKHISFFTSLTITTCAQQQIGSFQDKKCPRPITGLIKRVVSHISDSQHSLTTTIKKERKHKMIRASKSEFNFAFRGEQKEEAFKHLYTELNYMCSDSQGKTVYISDPLMWGTKNGPLGLVEKGLKSSTF